MLAKVIRSLYGDLLMEYYSCFEIVVERGLVGDGGLNHRKLPKDTVPRTERVFP
jgi:hypothetical protein